jgi:hypothetical protein
MQNQPPGTQCSSSKGPLVLSVCHRPKLERGSVDAETDFYREKHIKDILNSEHENINGAQEHQGRDYHRSPVIECQPLPWLPVPMKTCTTRSHGHGLGGYGYGPDGLGRLLVLNVGIACESVHAGRTGDQQQYVLEEWWEKQFCIR